MTSKLTRRAVLAGAGAVVLPGCGRLLSDSTLLVPPELVDLVTALEEARTRHQAVEAAGEYLTGGGTLDVLGRALLVACSRQLDFSVLGFAAHPLWIVWPAREIGRRSSDADAVVAALHAVELFKLEHRESRGKREQVGELGDLPVADAASLIGGEGPV